MLNQSRVTQYNFKVFRGIPSIRKTHGSENVTNRSLSKKAKKNMLLRTSFKQLKPSKNLPEQVMKSARVSVNNNNSFEH